MAWLSRFFHKQPATDDSRFGYAVVGTGHGAEKMCEALRDSPHAHVSAIVSRSQDKAQKFARRYGISGAYSYENFSELAGNARVDAVYLAVPVALHREFTERAAAAGKHVLCEKPMAATVADAEAMIAACSAAGRLLMIAYRLDYDPMHTEAARLLAAGALGEIRKVTSAFGIVAKDGWRFDPNLSGGGSLFDVGVYPVHAVQNFFGDAVIKTAQIKRLFTADVEMDATWSGTVAGGVPFECRSSYLERVPDTVRITGERGWITLENAFAYQRTRLQAEYKDSTGTVQRVELKDEKRNPSLFRLEAEHLAACVRERLKLRSPGEAGLRDMLTVQRIEALANTGEI